MHMGFTIQGGGGLGRELWQKCHGSVGPYWTVQWTQGTLGSTFHHLWITYSPWPHTSHEREMVLIHTAMHQQDYQFATRIKWLVLCHIIVWHASHKPAVDMILEDEKDGDLLLTSPPSLRPGTHVSQSFTGFEEVMLLNSNWSSFSFCHVSLLIENWQQKCPQPQIPIRTWRRSNRLKYFDFYEFLEG